MKYVLILVSLISLKSVYGFDLSHIDIKEIPVTDELRKSAPVLKSRSEVIEYFNDLCYERFGAEYSYSFKVAQSYWERVKKREWYVILWNRLMGYDRDFDFYHAQKRRYSIVCSKS